MNTLAEIFKALTDLTRMKILELLREKDLTPSEILEKIEVSQPTLSHHLDILKRASLIDGQREGQFIRYSLNMSVFAMAVEHMMKFMKKR
jgi:ArsR family transcriptional regulator, arsenate/arsenite/antimonite-responsive transcriptional repressor